jgi:hypothetical protein
MKFDSLLSDLIGTVLGGAALTLLLFLAKEKLFPLPKVSGRWFFETRTVTSAYKPFVGMSLQYVAILWQEGHVIRGSCEKIYEDSSTGKREYVGENRARGGLEGFIEKFYLGKDRIRIHLVESGSRESSVFFDLTNPEHSSIVGVFCAMAADQEGTVKWQRVPFR